VTGRDDLPAVILDVRRGSPTEEELAALLAVVGEVFAAEAASPATERAQPRSRWRHSARGLRSPLSRENGWGGFSV
jgi:hypothetical protein